MPGSHIPSLASVEIHAQSTKPNDAKDGVIWVDTSVSPRDTYVYSEGSSSWELIRPDAGLGLSGTHTLDVNNRVVVLNSGTIAGAHSGTAQDPMAQMHDTNTGGYNVLEFNGNNIYQKDDTTPVDGHIAVHGSSGDITFKTTTIK